MEILLAYLVTLQRVLAREGLPATPVAYEWLLASVRVPVPLQVVLPIERQRTHVAGEWPLRRRRILRHTCLLCVGGVARIHRRMGRHGWGMWGRRRRVPVWMRRARATIR